LTTDDFFDKLSKEQQRKLQFLNNDSLRLMTDFQKIEVLKYLEKNPGTNKIDHDFLRELGMIPEGSNKKYIEQRIETPLLMNYTAIMETGKDLAHHEAMRLQQKFGEMLEVMAVAMMPRPEGQQNNNRSTQSGAQQQQANNRLPVQQNTQQKQTVTSNKGNVFDFTQSQNHSTGKAGENPIKGNPNSSMDILDSQGNFIRRRWFDGNGLASRDVDLTNHGNPATHPEWPHEHMINWSLGYPQRIP
jgi:hypothetical protein